MDLVPLETAAITAAATIIPVCALYVAALIQRNIRNVQAAALLTRAETIGAGIAHDALTRAVASGAPNWGAAKTVAIQEGLDAARVELASVSLIGVTAALAPLLAVDPSVPAGPASSATATAGAGGTAAAIAEPAGLLPPVTLHEQPSSWR